MKLRCLALVALFVFAASTVRADVITFNFAVNVSTVFFNFADTPGELGFLSGIAVGDTLTGSYTFDTVGDNLDPTPDQGIYVFPDSPYGIHFDGGPSYTGVGVTNSTLHFNVLALLPSISDLLVFNLIANNNVLPGSSLPASAPALSLFDSANQFYLSQETPNDILLVIGVITSLSVRETPEPTTFALMGVGIVAVAFGGLRLRKRRKL